MTVSKEMCLLTPRTCARLVLCVLQEFRCLDCMTMWKWFGDEGLYFKGRDLAVSMNARGAGFGGDKLCPHVVGSAEGRGGKESVWESLGSARWRKTTSVWVDRQWTDWRERFRAINGRRRDQSRSQSRRSVNQSVSPAGGSVGGQSVSGCGGWGQDAGGDPCTLHLPCNGGEGGGRLILETAGGSQHCRQDLGTNLEAQI